MKYLLAIMTVLLFLGCGGSDNKANLTEQSDISNTDALQPSVQNTELQPPKPPAL